MITFKDFKKLEIKIGTIVSAEKIENADKLIKLIIDIGEEKREIIAGIAQFYITEELVGKQVPILVNLEPKTFMGYTSYGMLLAADDAGKPVLLLPDKKILPGSMVK